MKVRYLNGLSKEETAFVKSVTRPVREELFQHLCRGQRFILPPDTATILWVPNRLHIPTILYLWNVSKREMYQPPRQFKNWRGKRSKRIRGVGISPNNVMGAKCYDSIGHTSKRK